MQPMRWAILLAVLATAGCGTEKAGDKGSTLATDTALAADLREIAADTSLYAEAADVSMRDIPDSTLPMPAPSAMTTTPNRQATMRAETPSPTRPTPVPVTPPAVRPAPAPLPAAAAAPSRAASAPPQPVRNDVPPAPGSYDQPTAACNSPTTADQRRCLLAYLSRSDVTLTRHYQARIAALKREAGTAPGQPEPESVQRLRVAQRAWLVYRDTECRNRNRGREGPLWAATRARCLAEFSDARAAELAP